MHTSTYTHTYTHTSTSSFRHCQKEIPPVSGVDERQTPRKKEESERETERARETDCRAWKDGGEQRDHFLLLSLLSFLHVSISVYKVNHRALISNMVANDNRIYQSEHLIERTTHTHTLQPTLHSHTFVLHPLLHTPTHCSHMPQQCVYVCVCVCVRQGKGKLL